MNTLPRSRESKKILAALTRNAEKQEKQDSKKGQGNVGQGNVGQTKMTLMNTWTSVVVAILR